MAAVGRLPSQEGTQEIPEAAAEPVDLAAAEETEAQESPAEEPVEAGDLERSTAAENAAVPEVRETGSETEDQEDLVIETEFLEPSVG